LQYTTGIKTETEQNIALITSYPCHEHLQDSADSDELEDGILKEHSVQRCLGWRLVQMPNGQHLLISR